MTNHTEHNETTETKAEPSPYVTPHWVKLFGIGVIIIALLIGIMLLTGEHGPGQHMSGYYTQATEQSE
jgi:hypothetical protein